MSTLHSQDSSSKARLNSSSKGSTGPTGRSELRRIPHGRGNRALHSVVLCRVPSGFDRLQPHEGVVETHASADRSEGPDPLPVTDLRRGKGPAPARNRSHLRVVFRSQVPVQQANMA